MDVKLGPADLKDGEFRSYEIGSEGFVLVTRHGGKLWAIDDRCNHAGCLLSGGWLEDADIVCPCHEYRFDVRTGENTTMVRLCDDQLAFPLRIEGDTIVVDVPEKYTW